MAAARSSRYPEEAPWRKKPAPRGREQFLFNRRFVGFVDVESFIGAVHELGQGLADFVAGEACTDGQTVGKALGTYGDGILEVGEEGFGDGIVFGIEDNDELVAADTRCEGGRVTADVTHGIGHNAQSGIPFEMTEVVVDVLEIIHVYIEHVHVDVGVEGYESMLQKINQAVAVVELGESVDGNHLVLQAEDVDDQRKSNGHADEPEIREINLEECCDGGNYDVCGEHESTDFHGVNRGGQSNVQGINTDCRNTNIVNSSQNRVVIAAMIAMGVVYIVEPAGGKSNTAHHKGGENGKQEKSLLKLRKIRSGQGVMYKIEPKIGCQYRGGEKNQIYKVIDGDGNHGISIDDAPNDTGKKEQAFNQNAVIQI